MTLETLPDTLPTFVIDLRREVLEMPVIRCPHCGDGSDIEVAINVTKKDSRAIRYGGEVMSHIGFCRLCNGQIWFETDKRMPDRIIHSYPPLVMRVPEELTASPKVKQAFEEAIRCRGADSPNGALLMCRRAIQEALNDLDAPKGDLPKQLRALVAEGKLTRSLADAADQARIGGRIAAHGTGGDEWGDADKIWGDINDADAVIEFCNQFFIYLYVLPERTRKWLEPKPPDGESETSSSG